MADPSAKYEAKLRKQTAEYARRIREIYDRAIIEISLFSSSISLQGAEFTLSAFPAIQAKLNQLVAQMADQMTATIIRSVADAWNLSNEKNNIISDSLVADRPMTQNVRDLIYNPNKGAYDAFVKRVEKGMNLSDRVWKLTEPFKFELEAGLADGINKGESAAEMATKMKNFLKEPDKLFRRVRDAETGQLKLSKAARDYHPGQGVYRSSYQNAIRLTGTETNISYRKADSERWSKQTFTKGIEVRTSNNHPEYDICDEMKGNYPKDFVFTGWHPRCRCHAVPILATSEEMDKLEDELLGISDSKTVLDQVKEMPASAKEFVRNNADRIAGWKSKPYWLQDNTKYMKPLFSKKKPKS